MDVGPEAGGSAAEGGVVVGCEFAGAEMEVVSCCEGAEFRWFDEGRTKLSNTVGEDATFYCKSRGSHYGCCLSVCKWTYCNTFT